jgi:hypothetical protein
MLPGWLLDYAFYQVSVAFADPRTFGITVSASF